MYKLYLFNDRITMNYTFINKNPYLLQIVYTVTIQTACNNSHFITLDSFNVLKILLI